MELFLGVKRKVFLAIYPTEKVLFDILSTVELRTSGTSHHSVLAGPRGATSAMAEGRTLLTGGGDTAGGDVGCTPGAPLVTSYASESESPVSRHTDWKRNHVLSIIVSQLCR